jgi:rare lipoprotein A
MQKVILSLLSLSFSILVCTENLSAQRVPLNKSKASKSSKKIIIKYGIASYYAKKFSGRKTFTGNIYNSSKLTAACNVLPMGTWVKITNLKNERSVVVEINDRLHPKNKRLIDVSKKAAHKLKFVSSGITRVKVEVLGKLKRS